jgi:hypothetical protein
MEIIDQQHVVEQLCRTPHVRSAWFFKKVAQLWPPRPAAARVAPPAPAP